MYINFSLILVFYNPEKLVRFESLLMKCKENIKGQKERIAQLQADNEAVKQTEAAKSNELADLQVGFLFLI